jgi:MOSC domain-containing protein YiiM
VQAELIDQLNQRDFKLRVSDLGENISTRGVDFLALSYGTLLRLGETAVVRITGLRAPCSQIDKFCKGLRPHRYCSLAGKRQGLEGWADGVVVWGDRVTRNENLRQALPWRSRSPKSNLVSAEPLVNLGIF